MSESEKGEIMQQMSELPPILQAKAEGFVKGLLAAANKPSKEQTERKAERGEKAG